MGTILFLTYRSRALPKNRAAGVNESGSNGCPDTFRQLFRNLSIPQVAWNALLRLKKRAFQDF